MQAHLRHTVRQAPIRQPVLVPCLHACRSWRRGRALGVQVLWTFSIYLEAVAILPQLVLLQRTQNIDNLTGNYVFLLGCVQLYCMPGQLRPRRCVRHAHQQCP